MFLQAFPHLLLLLSHCRIRTKLQDQTLHWSPVFAALPGQPEGFNLRFFSLLKILPTALKASTATEQLNAFRPHLSSTRSKEKSPSHQVLSSDSFLAWVSREQQSIKKIHCALVTRGRAHAWCEFRPVTDITGKAVSEALQTETHTRHLGTCWIIRDSKESSDKSCASIHPDTDWESRGGESSQWKHSWMQVPAPLTKHQLFETKNPEACLRQLFRHRSLQLFRIPSSPASPPLEAVPEAQTKSLCKQTSSLGQKMPAAHAKGAAPHTMICSFTLLLKPDCFTTAFAAVHNRKSVKSAAPEQFAFGRLTL